jgi:hypothetical protein
LVLSPQQSHDAQSGLTNILEKYIQETERWKFTADHYEFHYHELIFGNRIYRHIPEIERKKMADEVFDLIAYLKPVLFATAINKVQLKNVYGLHAYEPRILGMIATIHRYSIYLEREKMIGSIIVDEEQYKKDKDLRILMHDFKSSGITIRGSSYNPILENKLKNIIDNISFTASHHSAGIQLADAVSRVTFSHFERNKSDRFNQLAEFWDSKDNSFREPSVIPKRDRWSP